MGLESFPELIGPKGADIIGDEGAFARLRSKGVRTTPKSISGIRSYSPPKGNIIFRRIAGSHLRNSGDASEKNNYYLEIVQSGQDLRTYKGGEHSEAYTSRGFTTALARRLGITPITLDKGLLAMRHDMIYADLFTDNSEINGVLSTIVGRFLEHSLNYSPAQVSRPLTQFQELWNPTQHKTITNFYRILYSCVRSSVSRGTWVPYELDLITAFYTKEQVFGNSLTVFDYITLKSEISGKPLDHLAASIADTTHVPCFRDTIMVHRNALMLGHF